jgi:uncharacterized membrane protein YdjX (TVP38/TMEM64 family)
VLAALAASGTLHDALIGVLAATEEIVHAHPVLGAAAFMALAAVSAMFTFASIAVLVPAAVFAWGAGASIAALWIGWVIGGSATYAIGRYLGRPVGRGLTASESLQRLEHRIPADAPFWLVLVFQLALPSEIVGYVLGLVNYPFARYIAALGIAELPYTLATVYLGDSFVHGRSSVIVAIGAGITALSVLALYLLRRSNAYIYMSSSRVTP